MYSIRFSAIFLPAYAYCSGSDSEHALASEIRQRSADSDTLVTPTRASDRLRPTRYHRLRRSRLLLLPPKHWHRLHRLVTVVHVLNHIYLRMRRYDSKSTSDPKSTIIIVLSDPFYYECIQTWAIFSTCRACAETDSVGNDTAGFTLSMISCTCGIIILTIKGCFQSFFFRWTVGKYSTILFAVYLT